MAIVDLVKKAEDSQKEMIAGQVKVGISVVKVSTAGVETKVEIDEPSCKEVRYAKFKDEWCEIIDEKEFKTGSFYKWNNTWFYDKLLVGTPCYVIKVSKDKEPKSYPNSVDYFIIPEGYDKKVGKRCSSLNILLDISRPLESVIVTRHMKFENGKPACHGDGSTLAENFGKGEAKRWNHDTRKWEVVPCLCAYSRKYPADKIIKEISFDKVKGVAHREKKKGQDTIHQLFLQGAWRSVASKEADKYTLEDMEYSCDVNYRFDFICPDFGTFNKFRFAGKGEQSAIRFMKQIAELQKYLGGVDTSLVPLLLKVQMQETNSMDSGKRLFPVVFFDFPDNFADWVARKSSRMLADAPASVDTNTGEETDFEEVE